MPQTEARRVQREPRGAAVVRGRSAVKRAVVHVLAAERRASLAQVNPHLVRAAGLQAALDQGIGAEFLNDPHMSHRPLTFPGPVTATAATVATVTDQPRFDAPIRRPTADDGQVPACDGVRPELLAEVALGLDGAGEGHQTAGILIQPVYGTHARWPLGSTFG
jgi:hypothetical protein